MGAALGRIEKKTRSPARLSPRAGRRDYPRGVPVAGLPTRRRVVVWAPNRAGKTVDYATRPDALLQCGGLKVIRIPSRCLGVQVVEVAKALVEAVAAGPGIVAAVMLAELPGDVALLRAQRGAGRVFFLPARRRTPHAHFGETRADWRLAGDAGRAAGGATPLRVPVGEQRALRRDAVAIGCAVGRHARVVGAAVELTDGVAADDQNIGFRGLRTAI